MDARSANGRNLVALFREGNIGGKNNYRNEKCIYNSQKRYRAPSKNSSSFFILVNYNGEMLLDIVFGILAQEDIFGKIRGMLQEEEAKGNLCDK